METGGVVYYGLADATDLWQPVDAGYAQTLKQLIAIEHRDWLDADNNSDKWFNNDGNENPFTAKERRILITHWAGEAWKKLNESKYDQLCWRCWGATGALITADGSEDKKIKPEGLPNYEVPPPTLLDGNIEVAKSNMYEVNPFILPDLDEEESGFSHEDELLMNEEEEADVDIEGTTDEYIFDIIDNYIFECRA